jgi:hypothetical protein
MYYYGGSMWKNDHLTLAGYERREERGVQEILNLQFIEF